MIIKTNILMEIPFLFIIVCMLTTIVSTIGCGLMRYVSLKRFMFIDLPNYRSSHEKPMSRAGGMPMALSAIAAITFLGIVRTNLVPARWLYTVLIGGGSVAWIGWQDDKASLPVLTRLLVHIGASVFAVKTLMPADTPVYILVFAAFWVAWSINFFNFMDGIDGLAGSEAILTALSAGYICGRLGVLNSLVIAWILAGAALGFLFWNWPPARIFMGDAGSGFLGFMFGCLAIGSGRGWMGGFYTFAVLLALFWFDATFTLLKRIIQGKKFWKPHKEHLYQKAIQKGFSHHQVTLFFVIVNMVLFVAAALKAGIGCM